MKYSTLIKFFRNYTNGLFPKEIKPSGINRKKGFNLFPVLACFLFNTLSSFSIGSNIDIPDCVIQYAQKHNLKISYDYYIDKKDVKGRCKYIYPCLDSNNHLHAIIYKNERKITLQKPKATEIIYKECH